MRNGENVWACICGHKWKDEGRPEKCPKCGEHQSVGPAVPANRLQGETYTLYHGRTPWQEAANRWMNGHARDAFQRRNSR